MCDYSLESFNFREAKDEEELRAVVLVRGLHQVRHPNDLVIAGHGLIPQPALHTDHGR
jgi:hypothetical protein